MKLSPHYKEPTTAQEVPKVAYRPKKMGRPLGPFRTPATVFERGKDREIDITICQFHLEFRLKGLPGMYRCTMEQAFLKALASEANFDPSARTGRIHRGRV